MPKKLAAGLTDYVCCFWVGNVLPFAARAESSDLKEDGLEEGFTRAEP